MSAEGRWLLVYFSPAKVRGPMGNERGAVGPRLGYLLSVPLSTAGVQNVCSSSSVLALTCGRHLGIHTFTQSVKSVKSVSHSRLLRNYIQYNPMFHLWPPPLTTRARLACGYPMPLFAWVGIFFFSGVASCGGYFLPHLSFQHLNNAHAYRGQSAIDIGRMYRRTHSITQIFDSLL